MPKNSFLQTPTSLPSICWENQHKTKREKKGEKNTTPMLPTPGVSYGGVASFPSRSLYRGTYIRTPFIVLWVGGFNMCVGKCLQFFMRWGHEHAHAIVTYGCLCKQAMQKPWDSPYPPLMFKEKPLLYNYSRTIYFSPRFRHVSQKWSVHGYDITSFYPFFFICMSGDTLWLFIEKVVVCGTLVVKF